MTGRRGKGKGKGSDERKRVLRRGLYTGPSAYTLQPISACRLTFFSLCFLSLSAAFTRNTRHAPRSSTLSGSFLATQTLTRNTLVLHDQKNTHRARPSLNSKFFFHNTPPSLNRWMKGETHETRPSYHHVIARLRALRSRSPLTTAPIILKCAPYLHMSQMHSLLWGMIFLRR